jgi:predicted phage terminase large subunit-like protein
MSLDTAYKPEQQNDPSVIEVWGYSKNRQYLIDVLRERLEYPELKKWIIKVHKRFKAWNFGPVPVLIEDAASGQSLIQDFKVSEYRMPVIKVTPVKSKLVRAEHATGYVEGGTVILPERAPWKTDFESEFARFPYASNDDQVDALSQYINWFYKPKKRKRRGKLFFK